LALSIRARLARSSGLYHKPAAIPTDKDLALVSRSRAEIPGGEPLRQFLIYSYFFYFLLEFSKDVEQVCELSLIISRDGPNVNALSVRVNVLLTAPLQPHEMVLFKVQELDGDIIVQTLFDFFH
jgi:hypothetical protein